MSAHPLTQFTEAQTNIYNIMLSEIETWINAVVSRKYISEHLVVQCADVKASSEITAQVAVAAGELSILAEQLSALSNEISIHQRNLSEASHDQIPNLEWSTRHDRLHRTVSDLEQKFRNLLWELFKLEESAYRKFIS